jgi:uncharacterized membrane protein YeiH
VDAVPGASPPEPPVGAGRRSGGLTGPRRRWRTVRRVGLLLLDLLGVFVFALSGGLAAVRQRFDLFGVLVLACCAGLGGGVLRDVLIGAVPPVGISDPRLIGACCAAGAVTFWLHPRVATVRRTIVVLDAAGLGVFVVAGTLKALELGTPLLAAVLVGAITGVGGGVVRDLLTGQVPEVLAQTELYATPALVGALAYALLWRADLGDAPAAVGVAVAVFLARVFALRFKVTAPVPRS